MSHPSTVTVHIEPEKNFSYKTLNHSLVMVDGVLSVDGQVIDPSEDLYENASMGWSVISGKVLCPCCDEPMVISPEGLEDAVFGQKH